MSRPERVFLALFAYAEVSPLTVDCLVRDLPRFPNLIYHRESRDSVHDVLFFELSAAVGWI